MSRSWTLFLRDMVQASRRVIRYTSGRSLDALVADDMAFDATLRNLEVLGEAAKGIPEEIRRRYPEVDWRGVAACATSSRTLTSPLKTRHCGKSCRRTFLICSSNSSASSET